jgi:energy-coupling factor transport system ATP-binding protein
LVVGITYVFINTIPAALLLMLVGVTVFLSTVKGKKRNLSLVAVFPAVMLLVYNTLLSPEAGGLNWWIIRVNLSGLSRGIVTSTRLLGSMLVSLAWLECTSIPEMYEGLAWLKSFRETWQQLLRGIQIQKREFIALTQSLLIRGLRWDSLLANIRNLAPLALAVMPRIIEGAQNTTLAMRLHERTGDGQQFRGLSLREVSVRYDPDSPLALTDVRLTVSPGERVFLAGPDGAGKTTLLRACGGVIPRVMGEIAGRVEVDGLVVHQVPLAQVARLARYVAPDPFASLYGLTVGQELMHLCQTSEAAHEFMAIMGLGGELWGRETTKLSGGQQVRLVLAGALASGAPCLLLDSPLQELDPAGRRDFLEALRQLQERGTTLIVADPFYSHFENSVDRVVVLEQGKVASELTPTQFFTPSWLSRTHLQALMPHLTLSTPGEMVGQLAGVHVQLEGNHILQGLDFLIRQGELIAITGPNGSGKTTAMLTLAGAIKQSAGQVVRPQQGAYVFQHAALQMLAMTVREELAFGPKILHWSPQRAADFVEAGLAWTGLDPEMCPLDLHPAQIRQLAIAACNTNADIVILDEPTVGVDAVGQVKILNLVQGLIDAGKAVVVITHDEAIARMAHRQVVIANGRVVSEVEQQGRSAEGGG